MDHPHALYRLGVSNAAVEHRDWRHHIENTPQIGAPIPLWGVLIIEMIGAVMATQDDINTAVATISDALKSVSASQTTIANDLTKVAADVAAAVAAGQPVDVSALSAVAQNATDSAAALASTVSQLDSTVNPPSA